MLFRLGHRAAAFVCIVAACCAAPSRSFAQEAGTPVTFDRLYAAAGATFLGRSIQQTSDGGYITAGVETTTSDNVIVMKIDAVGRISWQSNYVVDGQFTDAHLVRQTSTGYVVVAVMGPVAGPSVLLVLNLDGAGQVIWHASYPTGGGIGALPSSIEQTADGGYLLGAVNYDSSIGGVAPFWALKLDGSGNVAWQKVFGIIPGSIHATADGGFILAGSSRCTPTCVPWLVKLDSGGNVAWQKRYPLGSDSASAASARQTPDGGYLVAGGYSATAASPSIALLMKVDARGNALWQHGYAMASCVGGVGAYDAQPTNGGYLMLMFSPCANTVVAKLDTNAAVQWQDALSYAQGRPVLLTVGVAPTRDGGFAVTGSVGSLVLPPRYMVLKADASGTVAACSSVSVAAAPLSVVAPPVPGIVNANVSIAPTTVVPTPVGITSIATQLAPSSGCLL